jgi:hypothetical protein
MKEEQYIQDLFQTIRELPQEMELSAVEQFVLAQPAAAFQPPAGGGSSLLTIKNSIVMISSISVIGSAIILLGGGNHIKSNPSNKPGQENIYKQEIVPDSSAAHTENVSNEAKPTSEENEVMLYEPAHLPNQNEVPLQETQHVTGEIPMVSDPKLFTACDDKDHIISGFVQALVKDGIINPKLFSLKITDTKLVVNNDKQSDQVFKEYKELFEKLSGAPLAPGTSLSVSVMGKDCSSSLSINDKKIDKQNGNASSPSGIQMLDKLNALPNEGTGYDTGLGITSNNINTEISSAQNKSKNVAARNLAPFSTIVLQSGGSVQVEAGDTYSISLVAGDEAAFEKVKAEVKNEMLFIEKEGKTKGKNWLMLKVTIPAAKLGSLTIAGSGSIEVGSQFDGLKQLTVDGSGSIMINKPFDARNDLRAAVTGSGAIEIANLKAKNVVVSIPGSGVVVMGGTADDVKTSISGSGSASLDKLHVQSAVCNIDGSGIIEVTVDREITILISGSGAVSYWGNPKVTQSITGSGIVEKK